LWNELAYMAESENARSKDAPAGADAVLRERRGELSASGSCAGEDGGTTGKSIMNQHDMTREEGKCVPRISIFIGMNSSTEETDETLGCEE
jgi:hypothetical protein